MKGHSLYNVTSEIVNTLSDRALVAARQLVMAECGRLGVVPIAIGYTDPVLWVTMTIPPIAHTHPQEAVMLLGRLKLLT